MVKILIFASVLISIVGISGCVTGPLAPIDSDRQTATDVGAPNPPIQPSDELIKDEQRISKDQRVGRPVAPPIRIARIEPSSAAHNMLQKAQSEWSSGNDEKAMLWLERAQRISPQAGEVYLAMAQIRLNQDRFGDAEQLCLKALSLAGDDERFRSQAETILERVRTASRG